MFSSSMLGRVKPKALFSSLPRPGEALGSGRLPAVLVGGGTRCGGPGTDCARPSVGGQLAVSGGQQWRGMAGANSRHKKIIKMAKGFRGRHKNVFKIAIQHVEKSLQYAYRDRKNKRRDFHRMWIQRINAGVRQHGISYSRFINQAKIANVQLNRKVLSEMAVTEPYSFRALVETVKAKGGAPPPEGQTTPLTFDKDAMVDFDDLEEEVGGDDNGDADDDDDDDDVRIVREVIANDGEEESEGSAASSEGDEEDKVTTASSSTTSSV